MARDPLQVLLRLRGIALDQARRTLADRLRDEAAAAERSAGIAAAIVQEAGVQHALPADGRTMDGYAAWLARTQAAQRQAQTAAHACAAATADARASLSEARGDTRALEVALEHARDVRRAAAARQEQMTLDEVAGSRR